MLPVFVLLIIFGFAAFIVKMGLDYQRDRDALARGAADHRADRTLGMSELHALIAEAVAEAQAPLEERLRRLERRAERPALPPSGQEALLPPAEPTDPSDR